ncbi:uncharacterized protein [Clytia hemisphaerica]|uniref:uncharacterized protein n=1 Tax=Clytia hemisphaerica TaxID=252671 RepID=UPI0034D40E72
MDEEEILRSYFNQGFEYKEILGFLSKYHGITISYSTLLRKLNGYGLKRRNTVRHNNLTLDQIRDRIRRLINGPGSAGGYRTVWHSLQISGIRVPRKLVSEILKELDPEGTNDRRRHRLKRRRYINPGPNHAWHTDGYDKLKPWGFPIHGAIDGYSRRVLWLRVTRSNNSPDNVACFYLSAIAENQGCPERLVTDLGTENSIIAAVQSYFREDLGAHRYVSSPRNQRIESWWSQYCKLRACWWRNFFKDLEGRGEIDTSSELMMEALWYAFSDVLQRDLDEVRFHWNTHYIRKSAFGMTAGRPDSLYYLPELAGSEDRKQAVPFEKIQDVSENVVVRDYRNEYSEYFDHVMETNRLEKPEDWRAALDLYNFFLDVM